jgi:hypothetical protein
MHALQVLRAFRLFRLLGKMGDLKKIVTAVAMSIIPTLQALVIPSSCGRLFIAVLNLDHDC